MSKKEVVCCPFCGSEEGVYSKHYRSHYYCTDCSTAFVAKAAYDERLNDPMIDDAIQRAPRVGVGGEFTPSQWTDDRKYWKECEADIWQNHYDEVSYGHIVNNSPCYTPQISRRGPYVYLYEVDAYGDWQAELFGLAEQLGLQGVPDRENEE